MARVHLTRRARTLSLVLAAGVLASCDEGRVLMSPGGGLDAAKGGGSSGSVTVSAITPSFGTQGTTGEVVTITGSGFQPGAQASWLFLSDSVDTTVVVASTQFVNSSTLTSVINISPHSQIAFRNVKVTNADRTKGIGNAVFEVTQAIPVSGIGILRAANDNGEFAGGAANGTAYWSAPTGPIAVDNATTAGFGISSLGNAIVSNGLPRLYTRPGQVGTPWQLTTLPVDANATGGAAWALVADPVTGQVLFVGGRALVQVSKRTSVDEPRIWAWESATSSWVMHVLQGSSSGEGSVRAMGADTTAVGWTGAAGSCCHGGAPTSMAAIWRPDASGAWQLTIIGPAGSAAEAIDPGDTLIVGESGGLATYWQKVAGSWRGPITLPSGCTSARGVDVRGRIAVNGCLSSTQEPAGVLVPPYSLGELIPLGGLGRRNAGEIEGMSPSGQYVVGQVGAGGAVFWRIF